MNCSVMCIAAESFRLLKKISGISQSAIQYMRTWTPNHVPSEKLLVRSFQIRSSVGL